MALNGDYSEGKRSNRYLALALTTLSFNLNALTGTIFPSRRVNHYSISSSLPSPLPTNPPTHKNNPDMSMSMRIFKSAVI